MTFEIIQLKIGLRIKQKFIILYLSILVRH